MFSAQKQKFNVPNFKLNFQHPQCLNPFHKLRRICRYGFIWLMTLLLVVVGYHPPALTQTGTPFACDRTLYITRGEGTSTLSTVNTNPFGLVNERPANVEYNAVGFNVQDGFIYGMGPQTGIIYRIDTTGAAIPIANPPASPTGFPAIAGGSFAFAGDINRDGRYVVYVTNIPAGQPNLFEIDLVTNTVVRQLALANTNFADIAFNPVDDQLYAFDNTQRQMALINVTTGTVTFFGATTPGDPQDDVIGASFFNSFGDFFAYNANGSVLVTRDIANTANPNRGVFQQIGNPGVVNRFDGASCAFAPVMEKVVNPTTVAAGGSVTYTYRIANQSSIAFPNLTFRDTMDNGRTFVAGTLTNPFGGTPNAFGGTSTLEITGVTLPPRTSAQLTIQVRIPLTAQPGTVFNQSTIGPVPSNTNDPNLPSDFPVSGPFPDPTPLVVTPAPPTPRIGLAKRVASVVNLGGGNFQVTYDFVVNNAGNVNLNNVQVAENLSTTFGTTPFQVTGISSPSGNLTTNSNFNGVGDINLLAATGNTLAVGESKTIQLVITVTPGANLGPYNNQATATGQDPNGTQVSDPSQNGVNSDPDGDGDPSNNNVPTPLSFAENPVLGVTKSVASVVDAGGGNLTVTYSIRAQNLGDVPLNNLQLTENLVTTFGSIPFTVNRISAPQGNLTPNPNYNGRANLNLLAGTDTLAVGETKIVELVVTITPPNERRTFTNQVEGAATSPTGRTVRDLSQNGITPDPDGDRNPTNNDVPTPLTIGPNLRLVKRITNVARGGAPVSGVNFTSFVPDPNDVNDDAAGWSQLPGGVLSGVYRLGSDNPLQTGDEVEYTVYYLSDGTQSVADVKICDPIPENTTFIPNSFQLGQGILLNLQATNTSLTNASDTDKGTFFPPLTPVTSPCPNTNNSNGSVLVDVGNLTTAAPNNVGFIRFRVKID